MIFIFVVVTVFILLSGFLLNFFFSVKTHPYSLLLYSKKGTADFGVLRHKNPILP